MITSLKLSEWGKYLECNSNDNVHKYLVSTSFNFSKIKRAFCHSISFTYLSYNFRFKVIPQLSKGKNRNVSK